MAARREPRLLYPFEHEHTAVDGGSQRRRRLKDDRSVADLAPLLEVRLGGVTADPNVLDLRHEIEVRHT